MFKEYLSVLKVFPRKIGGFLVGRSIYLLLKSGQPGFVEILFAHCVFLPGWDIIKALRQFLIQTGEPARPNRKFPKKKGCPGTITLGTSLLVKLMPLGF